MVYPNVSDPISVPAGTPDKTLFVSVDATYGTRDPQTGTLITLEDCAMGYWTEKNLTAAHGYDCDWLMARQHGKIVGVWQIDKSRGCMVSSAIPKKSWPSDNPMPPPQRRGCVLVPVDKRMEQRFIGQKVKLGRCHNSLRGYFIKPIPVFLNNRKNNCIGNGKSSSI